MLVADDRKMSSVLGTAWKQGVPIEVAMFAWATVVRSLERMGCKSAVRRGARWSLELIAADTAHGESESRAGRDGQRQLRYRRGLRRVVHAGSERAPPSDQADNGRRRDRLVVRAQLAREHSDIVSCGMAHAGACLLGDAYSLQPVGHRPAAASALLIPADTRQPTSGARRMRRSWCDGRQASRKS